MQLSEKVLEDIKLHASQEFPKESCGLVIVVKGRARYFPCRNLSSINNHFMLDPLSWAEAEDLGSIVLIVHSHPNLSPEPSQADLVSCEQTRLPWLIVSWPLGLTYYFEPKGYRAPLIGREYTYGVLDCYTILQDYYKEVLNIDLDTPFRPEKWWEKGDNLYLENAEKYGFAKVLEPKLHDVFLMQVISPVPNHAAVYIGDGKIMHHQLNRLSSIDLYNGWYQKITTHIFRHKELL